MADFTLPSDADFVLPSDRQPAAAPPPAGPEPLRPPEVPEPTLSAHERYRAAQRAATLAGTPEQPAGTDQAQPEVGYGPQYTPSGSQLARQYGQVGKGLAKGVPATVPGLGFVGDIEAQARLFGKDLGLSQQTFFPQTTEGGLLGQRHGLGILYPAQTPEEAAGMQIAPMLIPGLKKIPGAIRDIREPPPPPPGPFSMAPGVPVGEVRPGTGARLLPPDAPTVPAGTETTVPIRAGVGAQAAAGPLDGISTVTLDYFRDLLQKEFTPYSLEQRSEKLGPHGFFGELSPSTELGMRGASSYPDAARSETINSVETRKAETPERVKAMWDEAFGPAENLAENRQLLTIQQNQVAGPIYRAFEQLPVPPTPAMLDTSEAGLMTRLRAAHTFGEARDLAGIEGIPWDEAFDTGLERAQRFPTARSWDLIKQALDSQIEESFNKFGEATRRTRSLTQLKNDLVADIDNHPNTDIGTMWRMGRDAYAGPAQIKAAEALGARLLNESVKANELPFFTSSYSPAQMRGVLRGLRADLEDRYGRAGPQDRAVINQMRGANNQKKIRWFLNDDARADQLFNKMDQEHGLLGAPTKLYGGSPTSAGQVARDIFGPQSSMLDPKKLLKYGVALGHFATDPVSAGVKLAGEHLLGAVEKHGIAAKEAAAERLRGEATKIFNLQGPERDAVARYFLESQPGTRWRGGAVTTRAAGGRAFDPRSIGGRRNPRDGQFYLPGKKSGSWFRIQHRQDAGRVVPLVGTSSEEQVGSPGIPMGPQPGPHIGHVLQMAPLSPDNPTEVSVPPLAGAMMRPMSYGLLPTLSAKTPWQQAKPVVDANANKGLQYPIDESSDRLRMNLKRDDKAQTTGNPLPGGPKNDRTVIRAPQLTQEQIEAGEKQLPDFVTGKITPQDWVDRQEALMTPAEIQAFSQWYKALQGRFRQNTPNDPAQADKYMRAWLVAQQNIGPAPAMSNVLLQSEQLLRGVPPGEMVAGGMPNPTEAARAVLQGQPVQRGAAEKISDFVDSAEGKSVRSWMANHPDGGRPFVVDVHTGRDTGLVDQTLINLLRAKGYNNDDLNKLEIDWGGGGIKGAQYENRSKFGNDLTDYLNSIKWQGRSNWTPAEIQAVGWMGMTRLTHERAEDVETAIGRNTRNVAMELAPGKGSPWDKKYGKDFAALPEADRQAITSDITRQAVTHAAQITGIDPGRIVSGLGAWLKQQMPSTVAQTFATRGGADNAAAALGHLLHQTEVWSAGVKAPTEAPGGFAIDFIANGPHTFNNPAEVQSFWSKVMEADPLKGSKKALFQGFQPIQAPNGNPGIRVLVDRGGVKTLQTIENALAKGGPIDSMISQMPSRPGQGIDTHLSEAEISKHINDWTKDSNGEAHIQRLAEGIGRDPTADLRTAGRQLEASLKASIEAAQARQQAGQERQIGGRVYSLVPVNGNPFATGGAVDKGKKAKTDPTIRYQYRPHGNQWCARCVMFRAPDSCTDVAGKIARQGWCKIFYPKNPKGTNVLKRQGGGGVEDEPPSGDPIGPPITQHPVLQIGVAPGLSGRQPGVGPMSSVKTADVVWNGNPYRVTYDSAKKDMPLWQSTKATRIRKDGSLGRTLTGIPETFGALKEAQKIWGEDQ